MATYYVTAPDGTELEVDGPEGAPQEEVIAQAQRLYTPKTTRVDPNSAEFKQKLAEQQAKDRELYAPTTGGEVLGISTPDAVNNALAGAGKALSDTGMGARQLYNRVVGDDAKLKELQSKTAEQRDLDKPLMDTKAGMTGNIAGHIALQALPASELATAYKAAKLGLPAVAGLEALWGAGTGALAPTAKEGELPENVEWNAALNGAIPLAGAATRGLVGEVDPARAAAAARLRDMGVDVSKIQEIPGALSTASSALLRRTPVVGNLMRKGELSQQDAAKSALFKLLGTDVPENNTAMGQLVEDVGSRIGDATAGKQVDVSPLKGKVAATMGKYKVVPSLRSPTIDNLAADLGALADKGKISGEEYAQNRAAIGAAIATAKGADKKVLGGLQDALDSTFDAGLSLPEKNALSGARKNYRLALQLRKQDIKPDTGFDLKTARADIERAAKKGAVQPDARQLLEDVQLVMPQKAAPSEMVQGGTAALALLNPKTAIKLVGLGGGLIHAPLATGVPQKLANDTFTRKVVSDALRGTAASKIYED